MALAAVALVGLGSALQLWLRYLANWRQLWTDLIHDRALHLDFALSGVSDLVHLRGYELARDINQYRTWPPLHDGVLVGISMLVSGLDPRAAVIPDLVCFVATAVLAFLLVGELSDEGITGGLVAGTLVLVSPAMRAFATDVMIEGAGACFTLLTLYAAVRLSRDDSSRAWRHLSLALSALFFVKYNYWLLVLISLSPVLVRAWPVRSERFTALCWWHLVPVAVWLAIPGKFGRFMWYLSPGSNGGEFPAESRLAGVTYYGAALARDYHVNAASAVLVAVLLALAVLAWSKGRLRAGTGHLLLFVLVATVATVPHPNRKSRFLHASVPVVWVLAGAGAGALVDHQGRRRRVGLAACGLTMIVHLPALLAEPHAPEGGIRLAHPTALELTDAYLPALATAQQPAILSDMPMMFLARWTYMNGYPDRDKPTVSIRGFDAAQASQANAAVFQQWLATGSCDVLVFVHVPRESPWYQVVPGTAGLTQLRALLDEQHVLHLQERRVLDHRGGTEISVWTR